jgi:hypothetical protein
MTLTQKYQDFISKPRLTSMLWSSCLCQPCSRDFVCVALYTAIVIPSKDWIYNVPPDLEN